MTIANFARTVIAGDLRVAEAEVQMGNYSKAMIFLRNVYQGMVDETVHEITYVTDHPYYEGWAKLQAKVTFETSPVELEHGGETTILQMWEAERLIGLGLVEQCGYECDERAGMPVVHPVDDLVPDDEDWSDVSLFAYLRHLARGKTER